MPPESAPRSAEDRTDLAEDRNVLATERTFGAWLRTGLAALAVGIAFERIFFGAEPTWVPKAGGTGLVALAAFIFLFSLRRYLKGRGRIQRHSVPEMPIAGPILMVALSVTACLAAAAVIWTL